jgi:Domain of unknown function (DUF5655)/Domain of unknown function (DUF4287)
MSMAKSTAAKSRSLYDVHPGVAMVQKWVAELKDKTGHSLEEWIALAKKDGPKEDKQRREWLKSKHGFGTNSASWISERVDGKGHEEDTPEAYLKAAVRYVEEQYADSKEKLQPIYDELLQLGKSLGGDVKACPCKTMVPLYRNHVFAQIKPTTNMRIDLGFALAKHKGKLPKRVVDTGGLAKKDRITHRIEIKALGEIDGEVKKWLKTAYDLDG